MPLRLKSPRAGQALQRQAFCLGDITFQQLHITPISVDMIEHFWIVMEAGQFKALCKQNRSLFDISGPKL